MRGGETRNAIKFITERAAMQEGGAAANEMLCSSPLLCSSSRQEGKGKEGTKEGEDNFLGTPFSARPTVAPRARQSRVLQREMERVADHDNRITASATARKGGDLIGAKSVGEYPSIRPSLHSTPAECVKHPLEDRLDFRNLLQRRRPSETSSSFPSHLPLSTRRLNQFKLEIDLEVLPFIARS